MSETTFQKVFRIVVDQRGISIPETGINPDTLLADIFGSTPQPMWAGFKFFGKVKEVFEQDEYFLQFASLDNNPNNELKTVGDLVNALDASLMFARERRTWAKKFERVKMNVLRVSENKYLNPAEIAPSSTLKELGLDAGMVGTMSFFDALEEDFQTDNPDFQFNLDDWVDIKTIEETIELIDKKLGKIPAKD